MTKEEIEVLMEDFIKSRPLLLLKEIDHTNAGIGLVLKLLDESIGGRLTAGEISEAMEVSTARVAVILKKMVAKGFINKESDKNDARVTIVCLSDEGRQKINEIKEKNINRMTMLIEEYGEEKFRQFVALSYELKEKMEKVFSFKQNF